MENEKVNIDELSQKLQEYISKNSIQELRKLTESNYPMDIAEALSKLDIKSIIIALRFIKNEDMSEIFTEFDKDIQKQIVEKMTTKEIHELFDDIFTDDVVDIIEEMPSNIVKKILRASSKETRENVNNILQYDSDTAGGIMSVDFIKVRDNWTVQETIEQIRGTREDNEEVDDLFVVDGFNNLKGYISTKHLLFQKPNTVIKDIVDTRIKYAVTSTDQEEVATLFKKYDLNTLPIVNTRNKLVGIVTIDDILDVIEEEATEDIHKMAGISPTEDGYFKTSVWKMVWARTIWLLFLMVSATLSQIVISSFMSLYGVADGTATFNIGDKSYTWQIGAIVTVLLTPLLTVISGTAGNAGSQSSTMVVRAISLGEVHSKDLGRVMWKELRVSSIVGLILVSVNFVRMLIIYSVQFSGNINQPALWEAIATVSIAMYMAVVISKVVGGSLPIIAKAIKLDPAVMAAPLLTTLVDALSTAIFFSVGLIFFGSLIG